MIIHFINQHTGTRTLPLASASLAAALEAQFDTDVSCPILELKPGFDMDETVKEILSVKPDILALTLYSWSRENLLSLAAELLSVYGEDHPLIIAGGPEVTADASGIQNHPAIDLAVSGEGEGALTEIGTKLLPLSPSERFSALHSFPAPFARPAVENLDELPSPWNARAISGRNYEDSVWELTRGCPFNCHFCFESKGSGRVRHKSLERAASELAQLKERGAGNVFLLDPTFNASPSRAKDILRLFIRKAPELRYHMEIRTEFLDEEQAELYGELGCTLQIGLQTAHPEVAAAIGRPFSPDSFMEKLLPLHENDVPYGLDLIYGLPGDSLEGFRQSLDFALSCAPNHLDMFPLSVLPGTRLRETAAGLGLRHLKAAPYTVVGSGIDGSGFTDSDISEAAKIAEAVDELYNKGRAVPWFLSLAQVLDLKPIEVITAFQGRSDEKETLSVRDFVASLASENMYPRFSEILRDVVGVFAAENMGADESMSFIYNPNILLEHLDMGITDIEELMAFVAKKPGLYRRGSSTGEQTFIPSGSAGS